MIRLSLLIWSFVFWTLAHPAFADGGAIWGGSNPNSAQVSCGASATLLLLPSSQYYVRAISNQSGQTIYLGNSGVTTSNGFPVPTGNGYDASHEQGALYCVAASAATVGLLQY